MTTNGQRARLCEKRCHGLLARLPAAQDCPDLLARLPSAHTAPPGLLTSKLGDESTCRPFNGPAMGIRGRGRAINDRVTVAGGALMHDIVS